MRSGMPKRFHFFYARSGSRAPGFDFAIALGFPLLAVLLLGATGCKVRVDKSEDGKNVKIATPFGSIAVNQNETTASDVGIPAYPGAVTDTAGDGNKSANVDMGFGSWKLRVKMAHYTTTDSRDQVVSFYRKALSEYGGVIECAGNTAVGTPTTTGEGLNCDHSDHSNNSVRGAFNSDDLELKAGSQHHQHLVVLKHGDSGTTHFSLIALDLPHGDGEQQGTN